MLDPTDLLGRGARAEKLGLLEQALEAYQQAEVAADDPAALAEALCRQSNVYRLRCEWPAAIAVARRAQAVAAEAALPVAFPEALNAEALVYLSRGDLDTARPLLERTVELAQDARLRGIGLQNLGAIHAQQGELDAAERVFAESSRCFVECGYERGQAIALNNQGRAALDRGDAARAIPVLDQAVRAARKVEDEELTAISMINLSEATAATGDYEAAHDLACTALGHFRESNNRWREVECLRILGTINERRGDVESARACYDRGLQLATAIDARLEATAIRRHLERIASAV